MRRASEQPWSAASLARPTRSEPSGSSVAPDSDTGASQRALSIDQQRKVIWYFGERLILSRYEFRLLEILASTPGRVYSRAQLMEAAWEEPEASMERTVDAHIKSLRSKLRQIRPEIDAIRTHRGFGYSLLEEL